MGPHSAFVRVLKMKTSNVHDGLDRVSGDRKAPKLLREPISELMIYTPVVRIIENLGPA